MIANLPFFFWALSDWHDWRTETACDQKKKIADWNIFRREIKNLMYNRPSFPYQVSTKSLSQASTWYRPCEKPDIKMTNDFSICPLCLTSKLKRIRFLMWQAMFLFFFHPLLLRIMFCCYLHNIFQRSPIHQTMWRENCDIFLLWRLFIFCLVFVCSVTSSITAHHQLMIVETEECKQFQLVVYQWLITLSQKYLLGLPGSHDITFRVISSLYCSHYKTFCFVIWNIEAIVVCTLHD